MRQEDNFYMTQKVPFLSSDGLSHISITKKMFRYVNVVFFNSYKNNYIILLIIHCINYLFNNLKYFKRVKTELKNEKILISQ